MSNFAFEDVSSKCFYMEPDGGFDISNCFLISATLTYYYPLNAYRIGYITIWMLFNNYFYRRHL